MKNKPWMMVCCLLPILFIFVAPSLGYKGNALFILIPIMLVCFMMMGKGGGGCCGGHHDEKPETDKKEEEKRKQGCH
jgi:hypothetical protein